MKDHPKSTRLHIPVPACRPGDQPDFSNIHIPKVSETSKPAIDANPHELEGLANSFVRVLDGEHVASGPWNPNIEPQVMRDALRHMVLVRLYDNRMFKLQRQGKISFYMKSTGEEAVSIAAAAALKKDDMLFPSYRQQGLLIARGCPLVKMMSQCLSNTNDCTKGRQMPIMYTWKEGNFFSISGNLGTQFPQAVGWAMASAYKNNDDIAAAWVGDGTTAEGDFHYAMTFASVYQAPVILNVVNNQWAISSYQGVAGGEQSTFAERGHGYGIPGIRVDGNDFLAVYAVTQWAAERARKGAGPTLVEHYTYRSEGHSTSDDPSKYRPKTEAETWPFGDPLERLKNHLITLGEWSEAQHDELMENLKEDLQEAYQESLSYGSLNDGPKLPVSTMFEDVYKEQLPHLRKQRQQLGV